MATAIAQPLLASPAVQAAPAELTFTLKDGLPLIQARIDGREATLLIDSGGAAALALRPAWAPADAASAANAADSQDAQGRQRQNRSFAIRSLELAGQPVLPPPAAQTWAKPNPAVGVDGYLGWGWLRQHRWVIDYGAQHLKMLDADAPLPADCGPQPQPLELLGSLPYARFTGADGKPVALGLDTGASRNVIHVPQTGAVAGQLRLGEQLLDAGAFVGAELQVPVVSGFLGWDFFRRHRVCLDPQQHRVWIQPL